MQRSECAILLGLLLVPLLAQAQQEMPLYAGDIPNSLAAPDEETTRDPNEEYLFRLNVARPTITVYQPQARDTKQAAVIILPGGSYRSARRRQRTSSSVTRTS